MQYQGKDGRYDNKEINYVEQAMEIRASVNDGTERNNLKKMKCRKKLIIVYKDCTTTVA